MNYRNTIVMVSLLLMAVPASAQFIFGLEGLNMPGTFNGFTNPPVKNAFAGIQKPGGTLLVNTDLSVRRYKTTINIQSSGGDTSAGTYTWLFTSGPSSNYYANKWAGVTVAMNTLQTYTFNSGSDNSVTVSNGKYYTVNWRDAGYTGTDAIWMETSALPVTISTVVQSPLAGSVTPADSVTITVTISATKSAEEHLYVRYSTDNFASSTMKELNFSGTTGTTKLPPQIGGTTVKYYVFSSTIVNPSSDYDMVTINSNTNGGSNYSYSVNAANYIIIATSGPNGTINPSDTVTVPANTDKHFTITPNFGFYVDSVIVDGSFVPDSTTSYTFVNVTANHTIRAVFAFNVNATFRVNMKEQLQGGTFRPDLGDVVTVRGGFNNWGDPPANNPDTLKDIDNDSIYTKTRPIKANTYHEYKFWKSLRGGVDYETIGNRSVTAGAIDTVLPVVYFNNIAPNVNMTFQVNMRIQMLNGDFRPDLGDVATVRGTFNDWGNSTNNPDTLRDGDVDSIYVGQVTMPGDQTIQYKFWKTLRGGLDFENDISNREYNVTLSNATIPAPYFDDNSLLNYTDIAVANKWNLVSVPRTVTDYTKDSLFPTSTSSAFAYSGSYVTKDTLENGPGYWLKFNAAQTIQITGSPRLNDSISVVPGWNLVGTISKSVAASSISSEPPGLVQTSFYGYSNGYQAADTLIPGQGYWVKSNDTGKLALGFGPSASPKTTVSPARRFESFTDVVIEDADGNIQHLYLGNDEGNRKSADAYELPPVPPSGVFDARFATGTMAEFAKATSVQDYPVIFSSAVYPVKISWISGPQSPSAVLRTGNKSIPMNTRGTVMLSKPQPVSIVTGNGNVPASYSLGQNYPNPFNPSTVISYQLPVNSIVSLKVYNMLGQEVATLLNETQPAGWYTAQWNASGVATGVYYYRISAVTEKDGRKSFTETRTMLLVK